MSLYFEIIEKDIAGRLGKLKVGNKVVRTPALLPVINPHFPIISPNEMHTMGIDAIITNAYIFFKSKEFRPPAEEKGLHHLFGFGGVIMTDSGAFQQSVYGDLEVTNREVVEFQKTIGSDIIVPLDIPTPPNATRERAEQDLLVTMERLREALIILGDCNCAGPVHGGKFLDLRTKAAEEVRDLGFCICPIGGVVPLMEHYRFRDLVNVVMAAKQGLSPANAVHLFGAGHPSMFSLAVAMGCDLFDSAAYALFAREGRYLTQYGSYMLDDLIEFPCPCRVCREFTPDEVRTSGEAERYLALHNLYVTLAEMSRIRQSIQEGTLWEQVDERCRSHPRLFDGYHELLTYAEELEKYDRASKKRFFYRGSESRKRTEVVRYHDRLCTILLPREVLISLTGKKLPEFDTVLYFKPPFGPYPPELAETFPIGQSELPEWDAEMVTHGCAAIRKLIDSHPETTFVILCDEPWFTLVEREFPDIEVERAVR